MNRQGMVGGNVRVYISRADDATVCQSDFATQRQQHACGRYPRASLATQASLIALYAKI